jgi:hypothetical protein
MAHTGFVGMSQSGKTTIAAAIAAGLAKRGRRVAVLDRMKDPRWKGAELVTNDPGHFLRFALSTGGVHLFVDEWGATIRKGDAAFDWLGTTSRHYGHSLWAIGHRWQQFSPAVRDQFDCLYAFRMGDGSAKLIAEDFSASELAGLLTAPNFRKGQFYRVGRFADLAAGTVDFKRGRFSFAPIGPREETKSPRRRSA